MTVKEVTQPQLIQHLDADALLEGAEVSEYRKYIADYASAYHNADAAAQMKDVLAYTVRGYQSSDPNRCKEGLAWGVTYMEPLTVDGECNLTRGHFHLNTDYPEYYLCVSGEGRLIKWDGKDEVIVETMKPGSLHWIDGRYAHRMCNVGDSKLNVMACYPTNALHNYDAIEKTGFPVRIYKENGNVIIKEMK